MRNSQEKKKWVENSGFQTSYAGWWMDLTRPEHSKYLPLEQEGWGKQIELFREKLNGEVLVDPGGGNLPFFASHFGARAYIGVNRSFNTQVNTIGSDRIIDREKEGDTDLIILEGDMLEFVSRINSDSVNFVMNGVDFSIIQDERYNQAIAKEMIRATKPGGLIFGRSAFPISNFMNSAETKTIFQFDDMIIKMKQ